MNLESPSVRLQDMIMIEGVALFGVSKDKSGHTLCSVCGLNGTLTILAMSGIR